MNETPLTTDLLRAAYAQGFFPMPEQNSGSLVWYNPDPRAIIPLDSFHCSRSLRKTIKKNIYKITFDQAFFSVMRGCAERPDTWIDARFFEVYSQMHREGNAHSVEAWFEGELVGGLYGVSLGGAFFAESKFHRKTDASKVALYYLVERLKERGFSLLEVQFLTEHLETLGAVAIPSIVYLDMLAKAISQEASF